jgi:16S rRNA (guanine1207-N2)-methyltransferase
VTRLELGARTDGGPDVYEFRTRDGLHSTGEFRDAELRALEHVWNDAPRELLVVQANYGVLGTVLAAGADCVPMTESSARAADTCRENVRLNGVDATVRTVARESELDGTFDTAVYVPKPYTALDVGKQRIADAVGRLDPGGTLVLAARERTGLNRYRDCLSGIGADPETVVAADGVQVLRATRPSTFDPPVYVEPQTNTVRVRESGAAAVRERELHLVSEHGLFAAGGLDDGTRLLLESVDVTDGERVLDLCCGCGPLGTYAGLTADCSVTLTDDDARATACATETLAKNGVDGDVVTADGVDGVRDRRFDFVLSNPPTHAGSGVLATLLDCAADVLARGGRLAFVHHSDLDLSPHLGAFESVERVASGPEHDVRVARAGNG